MLLFVFFSSNFSTTTKIYDDDFDNEEAIEVEMKTASDIVFLIQ
jgi:hypothetical protein